MKALICSSLHLRGLPGSENDPVSTGAKYDDFPARITSAVSGSGAAALFISGSLFDDHCFSEDLYNALYNCFSALSGTHVFICPGPSDPYIPTSPYILRDWPENVHIFKNRLKAFEISAKEAANDTDIRVYGIGATRHRPGICELNGDKCPKLDPAFLNILILPSPPLDDDGNIDRTLLKLLNFDAYIFGGSSVSGGIAPFDSDNIIFSPGGLSGTISGSISKAGAPFVFLPVFPASSDAPTPVAVNSVNNRLFIDSAFVYGFGKLADHNYKLTAGLNCLKDNGSGKAADLTSFIVAAICGFSEDASAIDAPAGSVASAKGNFRLPSRRAMLPPDNVPFGGELKFRDGNTNYILSLKWGSTPEDDLNTLVTVGGTSEMLKPGEPLCKKLWNLSPDAAAEILLMPSDGRDVSLLLKTLQTLPESSVWFDTDAYPAAASPDPLEKLRLTPQQIKNSDKTGVADVAEAHLCDIKEELNTVDKLEERISALRNSVREAEKEKNELSRKAGKDMSTEQIRRLSDQCSDFQRAAAIRNDAAELEEEIVDEEKYVRRGQRPWLVLLWILAVLDVIVIVLLTVYPVKIPWLGNILTAIANVRFPALYVAAGLFLLLIVLIAAVSGSGMRRLNLLKEDMAFRKRELSELLTSKEAELMREAEKRAPAQDGSAYISDSMTWLDQESRNAILRWDDSNESGFFEEADKILARFEKKADAAKSALSGAAGSSSEFTSVRAKTSVAADKLSALEAELSAYEEQLKLHRPYPVLAEKRTELEDLVERFGKQLDAAATKPALFGNDPASVTEDRGMQAPGRFANCADNILKELTNGARSGIRISDEMVPYIDDNGSLRGLGSVSGLYADQVLLSIKLAQLSLLNNSDTAVARTGLSNVAVLGDALSRFDPADISALLAFISSRSGFDKAAQLIVAVPETAVAGDTFNGNIIEL